jgi:pilus assembly protein CpaB
MNPKRIIVALTLALLVSGLCTWLLAKKLIAPAGRQRQPDTHYLAASRPLEAGELLRPDNTQLIAWPAANPLDGAFTAPADVLGRAVLYPLSKGQPLLDRELSAPGSGAGLAGKIPDGMRAVALRSDEVVGVAGFLTPGSHLDVLVTFRSDRLPEPVTATVLQNAVVLAAGQQFEPDPAGKPTAATVVTLLLTPQQTERAVLASTQGAIHFVLRNGSDPSTSQDAPIALSQLSGQPTLEPEQPKAPQPAPPPAAAQPVRHSIESILGDPVAGASRKAKK